MAAALDVRSIRYRLPLRTIAAPAMAGKALRRRRGVSHKAESNITEAKNGRVKAHHVPGTCARCITHTPPRATTRHSVSTSVTPDQVVNHCNGAKRSKWC